ncbi:hypothetical protein D9M71_359470 [compost metagenome]
MNDHGALAHLVGAVRVAVAAVMYDELIGLADLLQDVMIVHVHDHPAERLAPTLRGLSDARRWIERARLFPHGLEGVGALLSMGVGLLALPRILG